MAGPTTIPFGDPKTVKRWSGSLFLDILNKAYFDRKFVGDGDNNVIQRLTDLKSDAGDTISFDLSFQLRNKPTTGDNRLEGKDGVGDGNADLRDWPQEEFGPQARVRQRTCDLTIKGPAMGSSSGRF
jgi:hypothetical protein